MRILGPTRFERLNEALGVVYLACALVLTLSFVSFRPSDPSWNTATSVLRAQNLIGRWGSFTSDFLFQLLGYTAWVLPVALIAIAWNWVSSQPIRLPVVRAIGFLIFLLGVSTALALFPFLTPAHGAFASGGVIGVLLADLLVQSLNVTGAAVLTATCLFVSLYLVSSFRLANVTSSWGGPSVLLADWLRRWKAWREHRRLEKIARRQLKEERAAQKVRRKQRSAPAPQEEVEVEPPWHVEEPQPREVPPAAPYYRDPEPEPEMEEEQIPIRSLLNEPEHMTHYVAPAPPAAEPKFVPPEPIRVAEQPVRPRAEYELPPTHLLWAAPPRSTYDEQELKEVAGRIKAKFEEFGVLGSVVQINPGPVVTTFEYKPEAGIKYSKILTLTEDLCLGLQAESIFIERIPGKPTVGIEVPNTKREVIALRQILESEEFAGSGSRLTICLGKDINGRIKVASLEGMPHLLIAGSTGSGKSVMLNSLIMSVLYKSTPDEVRMILVDPKRVEMGVYEGIPHLLTPVITDAKQATYALRNAVIEMERRLKLLAAQGVRNIEQYNKKIKQLQAEPRSLFPDDGAVFEDDLLPLPFVVIVIDELADLMMLERQNVEASVTRLAQMARAVGMHLVLATQRPSVDVITGLIKANFPSRISFRVATRVDSKVVLDSMGAEHLLGRGDMLFVPPGSSRLTRVHGAFITESEINQVVEYWKDQAQPDYDQTFLLPPPSEDDELEVGSGDDEGQQDPVYEDAVKVIMEMGKASTSILQRRLRLGYGRAARILDRMQREGIIGPPDGSRPRDVLKRPDWMD